MVETRERTGNYCSRDRRSDSHQHGLEGQVQGPLLLPAGGAGKDSLREMTAEMEVWVGVVQLRWGGGYSTQRE